MKRAASVRYEDQPSQLASSMARGSVGVREAGVFGEAARGAGAAHGGPLLGHRSHHPVVGVGRSCRLPSRPHGQRHQRPQGPPRQGDALSHAERHGHPGPHSQRDAVADPDRHADRHAHSHTDPHPHADGERDAASRSRDAAAAAHPGRNRCHQGPAGGQRGARDFGLLDLHERARQDGPGRDPQVVAGPQTTSGVGTPLELALDRDGSYARNLALAYALTGDTSYATKTRGFLVAWAAGNTPTAYADCGDKWGGSYQSHGAFMFAYAYDLTAGSGVFSDANKASIEAWMKRFTDALDTYMTYLRGEFGVKNPAYKLAYVWDATKSFYAYENYVGGDNALLTQVARLSLARVCGYQTVVDSILNDSGNILSLESMSTASLSPRNDGDGVAGHPVPTPQVDVYKKPIIGRGGTIDYMTYNTRVCDVFLEVAENANWDAAKTAALRGRLDATWDYLSRFFGPAAEAPFIAEDDPSRPSACRGSRWPTTSSGTRPTSASSSRVVAPATTSRSSSAR